MVTVVRQLLYGPAAHRWAEKSRILSIPTRPTCRLGTCYRPGIGVVLLHGGYERRKGGKSAYQPRFSTNEKGPGFAQVLDMSGCRPRDNGCAGAVGRGLAKPDRCAQSRGKYDASIFEYWR